jgi:hypothetical protein
MGSVAAGMFNSAGITVEHVLYCWGKGENGQIGTGKSGPTALSVKLPTKVDIKADATSRELSKVTSVVCSDTMTAVLTMAGECVMFGVGRYVNGDQHDILEPLFVSPAAPSPAQPLSRQLMRSRCFAGEHAWQTRRSDRVWKHVQVTSQWRHPRALPIPGPQHCPQRRPVRPHLVVRPLRRSCRRQVPFLRCWSVCAASCGGICVI